MLIPTKIPFKFGKFLEAFQPGMLKESVVEIKGLVCDNPKCNYIDEDIEFKDYVVGQGCPKCGDNLLTQEDYDICKKTLGV
jgi:hypothetical protein